LDIKFHGMHSTKEAKEAVSKMMDVLKDRYGISDFEDMLLNVTLYNEKGEEVELVNADSDEVLKLFEVHKNTPSHSPTHFGKPNKRVAKEHLRLVVDNTNRPGHSGG